MTATTDWGALYRANLAGLRALVEPLSAAELGTVVPSTPAWTVRQVVAHVAGVGADNASGRMDDAPAEQWTARQVAERADRGTGDLLDELDDNAEQIARLVAEQKIPACVWDLAVHHVDVAEVLGRRPDPGVWQPIVAFLAPRRLRACAVAVRTGTDTFGEAGPLLSATDYELFRALFSRRSRGQLADWPVLADGGLTRDQIDEALAAVPVFGPRDDDVTPVPTEGAHR